MTALDKAQQVQLKRASDNRKLHVLSGRGVKEKNSSADIEQMIRQLIADLRFEVDADTQEEFDLLSAALGGVGSQIADNAPYLVNLKLDKLPIKHRQNWYWQSTTCLSYLPSTKINITFSHFGQYDKTCQHF